jgi:molybdopterin-guanine dinucleotide biosynthesis protein MobB
VAIARSLLIQPRLLLLDEPLSSLDQDSKFEVLDYLVKLKARNLFPMIYVSHAGQEHSAIADRFLDCENGSIICSGVMKSKTPPAISFVAESGTGKTTLIEAVIKELKSRNLKVGAIKHDAHKFDIDYPGKDSYRFTAAGADTMLISSTEKMAMVAKPAIELDMESVLAKFFGDMDIVLTEGYKRSSLPKIVVIRENFPADLDLFKQCLSGQIVAFVSDRALNEKQPILPLSDPKSVADFVQDYFLINS